MVPYIRRVIIERKSIEPIALNIKNGRVRAMQRFISGTEWDDTKI